MTETPEYFELPVPRTAEQKARDRAIHARFSGRKVSMQELLDDSQCSTTMGEWYEAHKAMVKLKKLRQERNLSVSDIAAQTGLPEEKIKALEEGHISGPQLDTLTEYAHALGKRVFVQLADSS